MPQTPFHPLVESWFAAKFGEPTEPQRLGWPEIASGRHTLIAAPTGSGKTLAAFLVCIDELVRHALDGRLKDEVQVVYVSPLKALSNDIRRNLEVPLSEIQALADREGVLLPTLRAQVRTGDTPAHERLAMLKKPPHILVTTPESLFLLLTAAKSRRLLRSVRTVIVDEIHALARDKRGSHLALSLERLEAVCEQPPLRVGLSATQKPMDEIARFLVGTKHVLEDGRPDCTIIDQGHARRLDLGIEVPDSELSAVASNEQWDEVYKKLAELVQAHRSTLIFVNTRRWAERVGHRLRELLGEDAVASHHGSLSKDLRLSVEERLKAGKLKAIVATASLELGIDIGYIDLVCQISSPRSIATFLQRVGRSGHHLKATPKGRIFALTRDELMETLALLRAIRQGRLDQVEMPQEPLDILEQQIVAEVAAQEWDEDALFSLVKGAWPYRNLRREEFDRIVKIASEGIAKGWREGAYLFRDAINKKLKPRKSARLTAVTSGGAIPETADYRVVTEEDNTFVGTVNEDFAIESLAGDVFQLGNTSWRIRYVRGGQVVVRDAQGAPATVPFWLGEAPGRTVELSKEVSDLREIVAQKLGESREAALEWLKSECGASDWANRQAVGYVQAQKASVGFVPTQKKILFERFFDEAGGMQLVIHSPYGTRINRAWGLALRKKFCRTFDFELQASADDNGICLSLGPQHSFPIEQLFKMLPPSTAREVLVQALLAAPMFQVRWRWNISRALAVLRFKGGKKVPPPLQRFKSDDLLTAVFPLQTACFENRPPDVPIPDHPLVRQTIHDCLHEAMDLDRWVNLLRDIQDGRVELVAKDTREPSPFSHSILNANVYSFLDDAPLEERRARAVAVRRTLDLADLEELARLDPEVIARVRSEAWPTARDPEELHAALMSLIALPVAEAGRWESLFDSLRKQGRAAEAKRPDGASIWIAAEQWPVVRSAYPGAEAAGAIRLPAELEKTVEREDAVQALARGRLDVSGPVSAPRLAQTLGLDLPSVEVALAALEAQGFVLQGRYTPEAYAPDAPVEWCERRLLSRIHRQTLEGARKKVRPVAPETFWQFLTEYHHLAPDNKREEAFGVRETLAQLQGFEMPAGAWEADLFPARVAKYKTAWLDELAFSGELVWGRMRAPAKAEKEPAEEKRGGGLTRVAPIALAFREDLPWLLPPERFEAYAGDPNLPARSEALAVYRALKEKGALFFHELAQATGLLQARLEDALSELAALGAVTADGFAAIRGLVRSKESGRWWRAEAARSASYTRGGRWTLFPGAVEPPKPDERLQSWAWQLLRRYGVAFRDLLARETAAPSWWELVSVYRRMEAQGRVYGGRFVSGVSGEQYALPEALETLRRSREGESRWIVIAAPDPLNLCGILSDGPRLPATSANRLLLHNGQLVATLQGGETWFAREFSLEMQEKITRVLRLAQAPELREGLLKELAEENKVS